ncbi:MAG: tyrosine recombinase XerC [Labilithrix sp.]|nr:tyrosine recombinase XerC [Labilithrix sp.]
MRCQRRRSTEPSRLALERAPRSRRQSRPPAPPTLQSTAVSLPLSALKRDFLVHLAEERHASPHTVSAYGRDLDALLAFVAARADARPASRSRARDASAAAALDLYVLRAWLGELARTCKPTSVARKIASVRSFGRWLKRHGHARVNPAEQLASPKVRRELPTFLSAEDAASVVESPSSAAVHPAVALRDRALLELLYAGGLRVSEASGLDLDQLELGERTARVLGKGRKERVVPLGRAATAALAAWIAARDALAHPRTRQLDPRAVFVSTRGRRLGPRAIQLLVRRYGLEGAGRADLHPHALRHTCATHLLDGGADLRAIQEVLGHSSLSTTQRYTHVSVAHLLTVYDSAHPLAKRKRVE